MMKQALLMSIVCVSTGFVQAGSDQVTGGRGRPSGARINSLEELTWPDVDGLDRQRSLFILPVGMVEQHGPHLPVGSDTIAVTYELNAAARRVSRTLSDWNVVVMPAVNYGQSGANQLGNMPIHPGT